MRVMLIPEEKARAVAAFLEGKAELIPNSNPIADNPWQGLLDEDD